MANALDTNTYIYRMGTAPNTRAAVSQKNKIYGYAYGVSQFQQIGVVSEFGHDESRSIEPVRGVGFGDQVAELVPGVTEPMTLTLNKTLLYAVNLFQVVGYKGGVSGLVRSLKHHRWPFDIRQELVFSEIIFGDDPMGDLGNAVGVKPAVVQGGYSPADKAQALFTFYEGCWLNSYSASYTSDAAIVAENGGVTVTDIVDGTSIYGEWVQTGLGPNELGNTSLRFGANSYGTPRGSFDTASRNTG
jgi:hypothetical protein